MIKITKVPQRQRKIKIANPECRIGRPRGSTVIMRNHLFLLKIWQLIQLCTPRSVLPGKIKTRGLFSKYDNRGCRSPCRTSCACAAGAHRGTAGRPVGWAPRNPLILVHCQKKQQQKTLVSSFHGRLQPATTTKHRVFITLRRGIDLHALPTSFMAIRIP